MKNIKVNKYEIKYFPWYKEGNKQGTQVTMSADHDGISLHVKAIDVHSSAQVLDHNGPVYMDSCFEFFFTPDTIKSADYINLEINCIGTVYMAVRNKGVKDRIPISEMTGISVWTSLPKGRVKEALDSDCFWEMEISMAFDWIEGLWGRPISKKYWYGNFYRCGGCIDDQYACWKSIDTQVPDFHQASFFGKIVLGDS